MHASHYHSKHGKKRLLVTKLSQLSRSVACTSVACVFCTLSSVQSVNMYCPYVNCLLFFCTVWSTLVRISLTEALVLWWCDIKVIWFDLIWPLWGNRVPVFCVPACCSGHGLHFPSCCVFISVYLVHLSSISCLVLCLCILSPGLLLSVWVVDKCYLLYFLWPLLGSVMYFGRTSLWIIQKCIIILRCYFRYFH